MTSPSIANAAQLKSSLDNTPVSSTSSFSDLKGKATALNTDTAPGVVRDLTVEQQRLSKDTVFNTLSAMVPVAMLALMAVTIVALIYQLYIRKQSLTCPGARTVGPYEVTKKCETTTSNLSPCVSYDGQTIVTVSGDARIVNIYDRCSVLKNSFNVSSGFPSGDKISYIVLSGDGLTVGVVSKLTMSYCLYSISGSLVMCAQEYVLFPATANLRQMFIKLSYDAQKVVIYYHVPAVGTTVLNAAVVVRHRMGGTNIFTFDWGSPAISGDGQTLVVARPNANAFGSKLKVYELNNGTLIYSVELSNPAPGVHMFIDLSYDGQTMILGDPYFNNNVGAIHIWHRTGNTFIYSLTIKPPSPPPALSYFGSAVSLSGDGQIIVGGSLFLQTVSIYNIDGTLIVSDKVNDGLAYGGAVGISGNGKTIVAGDLHGKCVHIFIEKEGTLLPTPGPQIQTTPSIGTSIGTRPSFGSG